MKFLKKAEKYFSKHVWYSQLIHVIGGIGLGIILARPLAGDHPVRWGLALIILALAGHLTAWLEK